MITTAIPADWRDLQDQVGRILSECGFDIEIEKRVELVRGQAEVDVYAEELVDGRRYSIVCECKHWKRAVHQSVVQSFRTVVSDLGANIDYIITTSDFQSGSVDASKFTNVRLLTWPEFQSTFLETWFEAHLINTVTDDLDALMSYTEPFLPKWFDKMSPNDQERLISLKRKYDAFGMFMMSLFTRYSRMYGDSEVSELPLRNRLKYPHLGSDFIPDSILDADGYREMLAFSLEYGNEATAQFRELHDRYSE